MRYDTIPSLRKFQDDTNARNIILAGKFNKDRLFMGITALLNEYGEAARLGVEERELARLRIAGQLYFATQNWLNNPANRGRGRVPAMEALFEVSVRQLAEILGVTNPMAIVNYLEDTFGKAVISSFYEEDVKVQAVTLNRDTAPQHRLHFKAGKAFTLTWWTHGRLRMVRANTADIPSPVISKGLAGYALTMDRELLMGRHAETRRNRAGNDVAGTKFTHAGYTGGRTVMCAGEIGIANGKVVKVTNSSGHYKPTPEKLVGVLELLRVVGADLSEVLVEATSVDGNVTCWASDFIRNPTIVGHRPIPREDLLAFHIRHWPNYLQMMREKLAEHDNGGLELTDEILMLNLFR